MAVLLLRHGGPGGRSCPWDGATAPFSTPSRHTASVLSVSALGGPLTAHFVGTVTWRTQSVGSRIWGEKSSIVGYRGETSVLATKPQVRAS